MTEVHPVTLSAADAAAVDQLLDRADILAITEPSGSAAGDDERIATQQNPVDVARRERVRNIATLLEALPEPAVPGDLFARTMAAVKNDSMHIPRSSNSSQSNSEEASQMDGSAGRGMNLSRRLSQLGAVAIAASILLAVLIPGIGQLRQKAYVTACSSNLEHMKDGFASYASANAGNLPRLNNGDGNWLPHSQRGTAGHSNTANLLPLVRQGYAAAENLLCAGRGGALHIDANANEMDDAQRGYSYANMFGAIQPKWDQKATTIVLADRNPLFEPGAGDDAQTNSCNHRRMGNNVLTADGSVTFATTPDIGPHGDNIWTVAEGKSFHRGYNGTETVATADDVFLAP